MLVGKVEQRAKQSEQVYTQATQALASAEQNLKSTGQNIEHGSVSIIGSAVKKPVDEFGQDLKNIRSEMRKASNELEQRLTEVAQTLKRYTWVSVGTLILAMVLSVGLIAYASMQAHEEVKNAKWIGSFNTAVAIGKLTPCPGDEGGLCAVVDKKYVRLDK